MTMVVVSVASFFGGMDGVFPSKSVCPWLGAKSNINFCADPRTDTFGGKNAIHPTGKTCHRHHHHGHSVIVVVSIRLIRLFLPLK